MSNACSRHFVGSTADPRRTVRITRRQTWLPNAVPGTLIRSCVRRVIGELCAERVMLGDVHQGARTAFDGAFRGREKREEAEAVVSACLLRVGLPISPAHSPVEDAWSVAGRPMQEIGVADLHGLPLQRVGCEVMHRARVLSQGAGVDREEAAEQIVRD